MLHKPRQNHVPTAVRPPVTHSATLPTAARHTAPVARPVAWRVWRRRLGARAISRSIATRCNRPAVIQGCGELAGAPHPVPGHGPEGALPTHRPPCAALEGRRALPRPLVASHCIKRPNRPVGSPWGRHLGPCSHAPHPQRCSRSTTGRGRGRYASSIATVGCQETSGHCGVGQGPLSSS